MKRIRLVYLGLLLLSLQFSVNAGTSVKYGGKRLYLPETGINFVGFYNLKAIPKSPPKANSTWTMRSTGQVIYGYDPRELWLFDQVEGIWKNDEVTVRVGGIRNPLAKDIPTINRDTTNTTQEKYDNWKKIEGQLSQWSHKAIKSWIESFCETTIHDKRTNVRMARGYLTRFKSKSEPKYHRIYMLNTSRSDRMKIILHFEFNRPMTQLDITAVSRCISSISRQVPRRKRSKEVRTYNRYKNKNNNGNYAESRQRAISSIRNMRDWWYIESKNYIFVSNMGSKSTGRQLQKRLEKSREAYEFMFPLRKPLTEVGVVRIFNKHDEYLPYVGKGYEWTGGLWTPSLKELLVSPGFSRKSHKHKKESLEITVTHEGFHQYIYYASNYRNIAPWFNEGTADFFGGIAFPSSRTFRVGLLSGRYAAFRQILKQKQDDIKPLLDYDLEEFYASKERNYSLGWALMFYLYKGAIVSDRINYAKIPYKYYNAVLDGNNGRQATKIAWKGIDMRIFQRDFRSFWKNQLMISRARSLSLKHVLATTPIKRSR